MKFIFLKMNQLVLFAIIFIPISIIIIIICLILCMKYRRKMRDRWRNEQIREIDNNEIFEKDDDVGSTFQMLKGAIEEGNEYLIKYYNDDIGSSRNR